MALLGSAAIAMWWDIAAPLRAEFEDWHSHEHFPERMRIPGFRRGSRWVDARGGEGFFVLYELEDYETLGSPGYLARLNDPTPWSARLMPHHRNMVRSQCRILESFGGGIGHYMRTLRLSPAPGRGDELRNTLRGQLAALPERRGLTAAHLLRTETPELAQTTEQRIRGGDAVADWIVLLSGYDAEALDGVELDVAEVGAPPPLGALYRLCHSLSAADLATP